MGLCIIKGLEVFFLIIVIPAVLSSCKTTFLEACAGLRFPPPEAGGRFSRRELIEPHPVGASPNSDISLANAPPNSLIEVTLTQAVLVGLSNNKYVPGAKAQSLRSRAHRKQVERAAFRPYGQIQALEKSRQRSDYYTGTKGIQGFSRGCAVSSYRNHGRF